MEKIKQSITSFTESEKGKDIMIVMIVILVGLGSFQLGRLSKAASSTGIKIKYEEQQKEQGVGQGINTAAGVLYVNENSKSPEKSKNSISVNNNNKDFFASNRGSKYYPVGCSAGKNIKQANRVYFATGEEAEKAGYELSSSC